MLSGSLGPKNNLILWTLLTDQEEQTINRINTCNADQIQFMYWLCLQSLNNRIIMLKQNSEEYRIFTSLPQDIQNLLHDVLLSQSSGWLSGLWQILKGRD